MDTGGWTESFASTGGASTGGAKEPNVEFFPGRDKNGNKTGKYYWTYTEWSNGKRKRKTPTHFLGRIPDITKIENCPHKSRVTEYKRRHPEISQVDTGADSRSTGEFLGCQSTPSGVSSTGERRSNSVPSDMAGILAGLRQ